MAIAIWAILETQKTISLEYPFSKNTKFSSNNYPLKLDLTYQQLLLKLRHQLGLGSTWFWGFVCAAIRIYGIYFGSHILTFERQVLS